MRVGFVHCQNAFVFEKHEALLTVDCWMCGDGCGFVSYLSWPTPIDDHLHPYLCKSLCLPSTVGLFLAWQFCAALMP